MSTLLNKGVMLFSPATKYLGALANFLSFHSRINMCKFLACQRGQSWQYIITNSRWYYCQTRISQNGPWYKPSHLNPLWFLTQALGQTGTYLMHNWCKTLRFISPFEHSNFHPVKYRYNLSHTWEDFAQYLFSSSSLLNHHTPCLFTSCCLTHLPSYLYLHFLSMTVLLLLIPTPNSLTFLEKHVFCK